MPPLQSKTRLLVIGALALGGALPAANAQVVRHNVNGHCGSPLAGPCTPDRFTYNYFPTRWRRWPTEQPVSDSAHPEDVPTPATQSEEMPAPTDDAPQPDSMREPSPGAPPQSERPKQDTLSPPFEETPLTPPFEDDSKATPFGDEPQAPPSAADPLAAPFSDEPPTPPADNSAPTPAPSDAPPAMPSEDPFKDDPEPKATPAPSSGATSDTTYRALQSRLAAAQLARPTSGSAGEIGTPSATSEPRLLRADGENVGPAVLPPVIHQDQNPLRQVSHPVQRTAFERHSLPERSTESGEQGTWRRNPLRTK